MWKGAKDAISFAADTVSKLKWSPLKIVRTINEIRIYKEHGRGLF